MSKIFIVCTGLGRINRGYETFTRECFDALHEFDKSNQYHLFQGAGKAKALNEHVVPNIHRFSTIAKSMGKLIGKDSYFVEQLTFFISFAPFLVFKKPHIIFYSDFILGTILYRFRQLAGLKYKLVFSNGAPNGPPFNRCDLVQQLLPFYKQEAIRFGESPEKHFVLPYAVNVNLKTKSELVLLKERHKEEKKIKDYFVVLCVAAINDSHKRISYLIDEVSALGRKDLFLIVLGQQDEESNSIINNGKFKLGDRFLALTLPKEELEGFYYAADVFILPSLKEGLPRVMLEAMSFGLPVFAHDYPVAKDVLQDFGYFADFEKKGNLLKLLEKSMNESVNIDNSLERIKYVDSNYSWNNLNQQYVEMFDKVSII